MRHLQLLPLLLGAAVALGGPDNGIVRVRLKDGSRMIGRVIPDECSDSQLVMRLVRGQAKRSIPWSNIVSTQASKLRVKLGFEVAEASGGQKISGHKIRNRAGRTFYGKLVNGKTADRDGYYELKTSDGARKIPLRDVLAGPTMVEMEATDIYTSDELYQRKLKESGEPGSAEDHFRLGDYAALVGALEQAKTHYEKILEIIKAEENPKYNEAAIARLLERVRVRIKNKEADRELLDIKRQIHFNDFDDAAALITKFRQDHADKPEMLEEVDRLEEKRKEKRTSVLTAAVAKSMRSQVKSLLLQKAKEKELTLRQAQQYAGGESSADTSVSHAAIGNLAAKLRIKPDEVVEFWRHRARRSPHKAFYRDGTFIVVDDLEDALAKAPRVKKGKKGNDGPKPPKPTKQKTPQDWWTGKQARRKFRDMADWLYAWWAEKSGMVELMEPKMETCSVCAGKGYTSRLHQTPQGTVPFFNRCQNCHMATGWRVVRFR